MNLNKPEQPPETGVPQKPTALQKPVNPSDVGEPDSPRDLIPASIACRYNIVPLGKEAAGIRIAMAEPDNTALLDEIRWVLDAEVIPEKADPQDIEAALRTIYGVGAKTVGEILDGRPDSAVVDLNAELTSDLDEETEEASVVSFVNQLLTESFRERATDIHIEPFESMVRIRYRIDGVLYDVPVPESLQRLFPAIVSRIKIMANLNIAEQRLPQDGRIKVRTGINELDLRIST
ncbi:MAG: type II/IV secretion system protein, partial [Calditrichaeota bacterium]